MKKAQSGFVTPTDERDIAAVALRALADNGHDGARHLLSGPAKTISMPVRLPLMRPWLATVTGLIPVTAPGKAGGNAPWAGMGPLLVNHLTLPNTEPIESR